MREIKFRVWDLSQRKPKMCKVLEFKFFDKRLNYMACEEDSVWVCENEGDGMGVFHDVPIHLVKIMQYTGIKDINGHEIYEGDIIKVDMGEAGGNCLTDEDKRFIHSIVIYEEGGFILKTIDENDYFWQEDGLFYVSYDNIGVFEQYQLNIIGNIYENPELLED